MIAARVALVCVCAQASTVNASAVQSVPVATMATKTAALGCSTAVSNTSHSASERSMVTATWPTAVVANASPLPKWLSAIM